MPWERHQEHKVAQILEAAMAALKQDLVDDEELAEISRRRRDKELGRWRYQDSDWVVYPESNDPNIVEIFNERTGSHSQWWREEALRDHWLSDHAEVAKSYFEDHPEPKPQPWKMARKDEIWAVSADDRIELFRCGEHGLYDLKTGQPINRVFATSAITESRRIWPETNHSEIPNSSEESA